MHQIIDVIYHLTAILAFGHNADRSCASAENLAFTDSRHAGLTTVCAQPAEAVLCSSVHWQRPIVERNLQRREAQHSRLWIHVSGHRLLGLHTRSFALSHGDNKGI